VAVVEATWSVLAHVPVYAAAEASHGKLSADHTVDGNMCVEVDNLCKYAVTCMPHMSLYLPYAVTYAATAQAGEGGHHTMAGGRWLVLRHVAVLAIWRACLQ
jgi:hypothetical protein